MVNSQGDLAVTFVAGPWLAGDACLKFLSVALARVITRCTISAS